jgi:tetratricopeptide (TPR) repeat protein
MNLLEVRLLKHKRDYAGAIEDYDQSIILNPNDAEAYKNRGNAQRECGITLRAPLLRRNLIEALENYDRAIQLNPNDADTYYNRGLAYYHRSQLDLFAIDSILDRKLYQAAAREDFERAAQLGHEKAQKRLAAL